VKQFLRYQISGSVFILWTIVFIYGQCTNDIYGLIKLLEPTFSNIKIVAGLVAITLPIGVLIHQLSVVIKNFMGIILKEFRDSPDKEIIIRLDSIEKSTEYCLERISNLNSFYYVRFDNGLLSPFLAWLGVLFFMEGDIKSTWTTSALIIGFITGMYLPKIYLEMKEYKCILKPNPINHMDMNKLTSARKKPYYKKIAGLFKCLASCIRNMNV